MTTHISLEDHFGVQQIDAPLHDLRGILHTKDYEHFELRSDTGNLLHTFEGAKTAHRCLPGDHIAWDTDHCILELRDEHPKIVGTIEFTHSATYGRSSRGIPLYLFTPHDSKYPPFVVGSSEKDRSLNRIALITFDSWTDTFPRGHVDRILGITGEKEVERTAAIWQASPHPYPKYKYEPVVKDLSKRHRLSGYTFHVDPPGCIDVDDVFTVESVDPPGTWHITITISDVAAYIEDGDAIDIMASLIGETLYDSEGRVLRPMLPTEYSHGACSLLPGTMKYGLSLQHTWCSINKTWDAPRWFLSEVRINQGYTYDAFQDSTEPCRDLMKTIASHLAQIPLVDSHQWVEQMMLVYNKAAGALLKQHQVGILRRHSAPDQERWARYQTMGIPERLAFHAAEYCLAEEMNTVHYGLETDAYAHASSPIRRYADLVNQRMIKHILNGSSDTYIIPITMVYLNERSKAIKRFAYQMEFLDAITSGQTRFAGRIVEKKENIGDDVTIILYVPQWKRMISTQYYYHSHNTVLSRDERMIIDVTEGRDITIECVFQPYLRKWKERIVFHLIEDVSTPIDLKQSTGF